MNSVTRYWNVFRARIVVRTNAIAPIEPEVGVADGPVVKTPCAVVTNTVAPPMPAPACGEGNGLADMRGLGHGTAVEFWQLIVMCASGPVNCVTLPANVVVEASAGR